jgi:Asp-tRNA(Asn)/Glu-tRNA(Gln) amidotransferase C subunit
MLTELPRATTLLCLRKPSQFGGICIRKSVPSNAVRSRYFSSANGTRQLKPPTIPDISDESGVDLDEFIGSPGWKLNDLLPPHRTGSSQTEADDDTSITSKTLQHLLNLSGLPPPKSPEEESKLLSALHDQLHFVKHVQSVPTDNVEPLIRVGDERGAADGNTDGVLTFQECVEESESETIPGLEWTEWDVCGLKGGSQEGRDQGYFVVRDKARKNGLEEE